MMKTSISIALAFLVMMAEVNAASPLTSAENTSPPAAGKNIPQGSPVLPFNEFGDNATTLQLTGILSTRKHPLALIGQEGKQQIYTIGNRLPTGHQIKRIETDRVTISRNNVDTVLYFGGAAKPVYLRSDDATLPTRVAALDLPKAPLERPAERPAAQPESSGTAPLQANAAPSSSSSIWAIPSWLQQGMSGPPPIEDTLKSPWSSKK